MLTISLCWCIYRDAQIEKQYTKDLRNRILGSRLQMDGISPYFYHWEPEDGVRYYDPGNYQTTLKISSVTASPFFHQLLYPIANFPQSVISKIWLVCEYLAMLLMTLLALYSAKEKKQKWMVLLISLLFLYTYAWKTNIERGQMYIFIPLIAMLFYFFVSRKTPLNAALAGVLGASLILIRLNTIFFFLPFLLLAANYTLTYKTIFLLSFFSVFIIAFGNSSSRLYWSDYKKALHEHVEAHQELHPTLQKNAAVIPLAKWEGLDTTQINNARNKFYYKHSDEYGNFFIFLNVGFHVKTPVWLLSVLSISLITFLLILFYKKFKHTPLFNTYFISLLGCCMYMASDIFSPIYGAQYNASPWIFPLLLLASNYTTSFNKIFVAGIVAGLFLNSISFHLIPLKNTVGAYLIYASVLGLLFTLKPRLQK